VRLNAENLPVRHGGVNEPPNATRPANLMPRSIRPFWFLTDHQNQHGWWVNEFVSQRPEFGSEKRDLFPAQSDP
jgi:hypothetical protein